ncbi:MAG: aminotransferase class I/II-fold pyridoxal phosphate-dependent enzyme [Bacillota bacterium]
MSKLIYLSSPHMSDEGYEQQFIKEAFDTNWIAPLGPHVDAFEKEIAEYAGVKGAAALSSGTAAIHMALKLCGVKRGDRVFCSSFTFAASANPIVYEGAIPVFIDSEPGSWNMSPQALRRALHKYREKRQIPTPVIVVNLYGQSADMDELVAVCNEYGVPIIEDAAESLGATYKNRKSGSIGKYGIYSYNGNKIITSGGGGMLLSNDLAGLAKARYWATQARDEALHYQHSEIGYNYRMSNISAAIGRGQLKVLDQRVQQRRAIYDRYYNALKDIRGVAFMPEAAFGIANRWLTTLTIDSAQTRTNTNHLNLLQKLEKQLVQTRPLWKPMHLQPVFAGCDFFEHSQDENICVDLFSKGLCLPSGSNMTVEDQDRVIELMIKYLGG